jgi:undecaprenyl diphosphate synthase
MNLPKHIAIIMDGNGRWAKQRFLPRVAGHQRGAESARTIISACAKKRIPYLTLFAFSSENWRRPEGEVRFLLDLFLRSLKQEIHELHKNHIRLKIIGDKTRFTKELQAAITFAEELTDQNRGLQLNIALNYGGQWDIVQATRQICQKVQNGEMDIEALSEESFRPFLSLADCPEPDLLIRTSGEYRISNFLLWQFAYSELYFTDTLWPDFRETQFEAAIKAFAERNRRFGVIEEPITEQVDVAANSFELVEQTAHA